MSKSEELILTAKANKAQKERHYYFFAFAVFFFFFFTDPIHPQDEMLPIWRQSLGGTVTGIPAVQAESAVVVLDSGNIKAFSTGGTDLWTYSAQGRLSPFVTRSREGTSYIARTNGTLIAVSRTGRELWRANLGSPLTGAVIPGWDGRVFVPAGQKISCYTGAGRRLWQRSLESPLNLQPILDKRGGILMVLESGELVRLDPFGNMNSFGLGEVPLAILPAGNAGSGDERLLVVYKNGRLETTGPAGEERRSLPSLPAPVLAAACRKQLTAQGEWFAAAVLSDGRTLGFSADTGEVLWTGESHINAAAGKAMAANTAPEMAQVNLLFDERGIYVLSRTGASGFAADGRRLWLMQIERAAAIPAFGDDGILYSGGSDWLLYAYRMEDPVQQRQSLYGPAPDGNYGIAQGSVDPEGNHPGGFDEKAMDTRFTLISRAIADGEIGQNESAYTKYLMEILKNALPRPGVSALHPQIDIRSRIEALKLLSRFASPEIIPFLSDVFTRDSEALVKAAAAEALGSIGIDPEGIALRAFSAAVFPPGSLRDERALLGIAAASGALCRFSGPPLAETGVKILSSLTAPERPSAVRLRAERELRSISN
ncbi:hypothetical protein FACS1894109_14850 [Spirochaetia bacterium]|nr:hypothetical protein FACS1894109_14850 [Spirochaetia bacterium]